MRDIKDYLHLYLGCQVEIEFKDGAKGITKLMPAHVEGVYNNGMIPSLKSIKPILRPLSDMTDSEILYDREISTFHTTNHIKERERQAERTLWLLKRGFDLFGLIESGLAIDKTKVDGKGAES